MRIAPCSGKAEACADCYIPVMRVWLALVLAWGGCGAASPRGTAMSAGGEVEPDPEQCTATLRIESLEDRADAEGDVEIPHSRITAVRHCERSGSSELVVGDERGICTAADAGSAVARVSCWWAGATSEIVLVRVEDALVVRRVETLDERVSGAPEELGAIGVPENSRLVPLHASGN
jgi:hypothetical protein